LVEKCQSRRHAALFKARKSRWPRPQKKADAVFQALAQILAACLRGGGAFGLAALAIELPISTTSCCVRFVEVARSEGHDVRDWATKLAAWKSLPSAVQKSANQSETPYWATRLALNQRVKEAAAHLAGRARWNEQLRRWCDWSAHCLALRVVIQKKWRPRRCL